MHKSFVLACIVSIGVLSIISLSSAFYDEGYRNDRVTRYSTAIYETSYASGEESVNLKVTERVRVSRRLPDNSGTFSTIRRSTFSRSYTGQMIVPSGVAYHYPKEMYGSPISHWRYKPVYRSGDYGPDDYPAPYYYEPRYDYSSGSYDWRW